MNKAFSLLVLFSLSVGVGQAEWFRRGSYKIPGGKWRKATIQVANDCVRVYSRKHRSLVAAFQSSKHQKKDFSQSRKRRVRTSMSFLFVGSLVAVNMALPVEPGWITNCTYSEYSSSCKTYWSEGRDPEISAKSALISIGVMSGIAAAVALPSKPPEYTFEEGLRNVTVRVRKRDRERFERALRTGAVPNIDQRGEQAADPHGQRGSNQGTHQDPQSPNPLDSHCLGEQD